MSEVAQVPQLRFPEFSGNWESKIFRDVFERITTKNKENNENVLTISAQQGLINQKDYFNKSVSAKDVTGYYLLHKDDFAYNKSYSQGYPLGAIKRLKKYDKGVVSTLYICFKSIQDNIDFLEQVFNGGRLNHEIHKIAQEGARNHGLLNISVVEFFKDIKLNIPTKPEQQKIAAFLTAVDTKIEQLSKKKALLGEYKKGLMQQIFSQAIRFKADDGSDFPNWEEKKLGDVVSTPVSDGPHLTPKFVKQGVPFLSVNNLVESKIDFSNVRYISIDDHLVFSKKCKPKKGDVLLGKAASVGKVAFVETDVEFNIWSPIAMIRPGNSNFSKYIYYCFQTRFILNQISKFTNSSSQGNIGMGDINKIIIKLPNKLEQTKIANLLSSIDSKIEQVGKQLRESKQFKKALLQQMFV